MQRVLRKERDVIFKLGEGQELSENEQLGYEPIRKRKGNSQNKILVGRTHEAYLKQQKGTCVWNKGSEGEYRWRCV